MMMISDETRNIMRQDNNPISISLRIMIYAHKGQRRINGEPYMNHPLRCNKRYLDLIQLGIGMPIDKIRLKELGIPFEGVSEVCLLHDVIEDSSWTIEDVEKNFEECGQGDYFREYIKDPLIRITHDKSVDYASYIDVCLGNPISALCKMLDLQDNINIFSLDKFDEKNYKRSQRYLSYIYKINSKYGFIEKSNEYREYTLR